MPKRLASQTNLISPSSSSEYSDQCLWGSRVLPEIGSLCQSGGNPVLTYVCAKYLSSPFRTRSASCTTACGSQERLLDSCPSTAGREKPSSLRSGRKEL